MIRRSSENRKIIVMGTSVEDDAILLRYFLNFEFLSFNSFSFFLSLFLRFYFFLYFCFVAADSNFIFW